MKNSTGAIVSILVAILIIVLVVLWHPWLNIDDKLEDIENEINENLGIGQVRLEPEWQPFGTTVHIYGSFGNCSECPEVYCGWFFIDLSGHTEVIHLVIGDIPAWWEIE